MNTAEDKLKSMYNNYAGDATQKKSHQEKNGHEPNLGKILFCLIS